MHIYYKGADITFTIGICGGSGSGKSTVAKMFLTYNILPIDTDNIYKQLTSKRTRCIDELVSEFGIGIVFDDFSLNRKRLAEIVFSDSDKLHKLNKIAHAHVLREVRKIRTQAEDDGYFAVIVDAPLLFESGFDAECDVIIAIIADESTRISRILERDGITYEMAKKRVSAQLPDEIIASKADYIIANTFDTSYLLETVEKIIKEIKNKFK